MTTEEILQSIEGNLSNAYSSLEKRKKVTIPEKKNFENLATTIDSIKPLLEEITIEAKTTNQLFTPSGENEGIGKVNVKAVTSAIDPNIIPTNIRKGKTILGVVGNVEADKPDQEKTVNPTTAQQSIVADTGYELAKVTINAVTKSIDANIKAENIKQGVSILGVQGSFQGSKAPALQEKIVEPSIIAQEITADSGYDGLSKVTVEAIPDEYIVPSGTLSVTENGTQDVTEYANVEVNVVTGEYNVESVVNEDGTTQTLVITHYGYVENYDGTYVNNDTNSAFYSLISFVLEGDTITLYDSGVSYYDFSMTSVSSVEYSNKVITIKYSNNSTQTLTYDTGVQGFVGQVYEVNGMGGLTAVDVTFAKESV